MKHCHNKLRNQTPSLVTMKIVAISFVVFAVIAFKRCGVSANYTQDDFDEFIGTTLWNNTGEPDVIEAEQNSFSSWPKVFWGFLYLITALIGGVGNAAVVWSEYHNPISKTGSRYFLSLMCASDAISSMFFLIPTYVHFISVTWPFGSIYCSLWHISSVPLYATSVVPVNALALDWLLAIVRPRKLPMTSKYALQLIGVMGIVTIPFALPDVLFHKYMEFDEFIYCYMMWPGGLRTARLIFELTLFLLLRAVLCLIPVIVMFYVYGKAIIGHWRGLSRELNKYLVPEHIPENREMFNLTGIIVIGFVICEFPFHFYHTFRYFGLPEAHLNAFLLLIWLFSTKPIICPLAYFHLKRRNHSDVEQNRYSASARDGNILEVDLDTVEFQANPARPY